MARFVSWWTVLNTTPTSVAEAAERAGVLVDAGDSTVGHLVIDDDEEPPINLDVTGALVSAGGQTWLVYPAPSASGGWLAQVMRSIGGRAQLAQAAAVRTLGTADDSADCIIRALLAGPASQGDLRAAA